MKLFMIGVGGRTKTSNIEVHDMHFVLAEQFEDTFPSIRKNWYGIQDGLHIDSYKVLDKIDGYELYPNRSSDKDLYLIYYGGIDPNEFGEVHDYTFVIASTLEEAKRLGKVKMSDYRYMNHIDEVTNVSNLLGSSLGFVEGNYSFNKLADWAGYIKL